MNWIKSNFFNILNFVVLLYVIFELQNIKTIAVSTNQEAELNNVKLDFVESDLNTDMYIHDSLKKKIQNKKEEIKSKK